MDAANNPASLGDQPDSASADDPSIVPKLDVTDPWTVGKALAATSLDGPAEGPSASPIPFFHLLERLKLTKREGWKRFGIARGESVADHMYRMAAMAMFPPPSLAGRLDVAKCMKMCLVHDMGESLVGDITPADRVPKAEKNRREALAMGHIGGLLGSSGEELLAIWREFEDAETLESLFVQDLDKIELLLQMTEYEKRGKEDLSEFTYVKTKLRLPETKVWAEALLKERERDREAEKRSVAGSNPEWKKLQDEYYGTEAGQAE